MRNGRQAHWDYVYGDKSPTEVSWYQAVPGKSLAMIRATGVGPDDAILDVGGGASTLVDSLLDAQFRDVTVLDVSANAFEQARRRLGALADRVTWVVADITEFVPDRPYALWHDRAVFHFLTDNVDRDRYIGTLCKTLRPAGHLVLATFGPEGPTQCSGLPIVRYGVDTLRDLLEPAFELQDDDVELHRTPAGATQQFLYTRWIRGSGGE